MKRSKESSRKKLFWDKPKAQSAVTTIKNFSEVLDPQDRLPIIADDPDNRILECAVAGQVDFIISGDKHLLDLKNYRGIKIVTPAEFLESLK